MRRRSVMNIAVLKLPPRPNKLTRDLVAEAAKRHAVSQGQYSKSESLLWSRQGQYSKSEPLLWRRRRQDSRASSRSGGG
jgi:hypothetical protein